MLPAAGLLPPLCVAAGAGWLLEFFFLLLSARRPGMKVRTTNKQRIFFIGRVDRPELNKSSGD
jgi:hypothetical protein